jgi:hypothetical protein
MANFSCKPESSLLDYVLPYRMVVFNSLVAGTVVWIGYRASLTSHLSVIKTQVPFNDMESLSKTDYRF